MESASSTDVKPVSNLPIKIDLNEDYPELYKVIANNSPDKLTACKNRINYYKREILSKKYSTSDMVIENMQEFNDNLYDYIKELGFGHLKKHSYSDKETFDLDTILERGFYGYNYIFEYISTNPDLAKRIKSEGYDRFLMCFPYIKIVHRKEGDQYFDVYPLNSKKSGYNDSNKSTKLILQMQNLDNKFTVQNTEMKKNRKATNTSNFMPTNLAFDVIQEDVEAKKSILAYQFIADTFITTTKLFVDKIIIYPSSVKLKKTPCCLNISNMVFFKYRPNKNNKTTDDLEIDANSTEPLFTSYNKDVLMEAKIDGDQNLNFIKTVITNYHEPNREKSKGLMLIDGEYVTYNNINEALPKRTLITTAYLSLEILCLSTDYKTLSYPTTLIHIDVVRPPSSSTDSMKNHIKGIKNDLVLKMVQDIKNKELEKDESISDTVIEPEPTVVDEDEEAPDDI